jgi:hypothetical protein
MQEIASELALVFVLTVAGCLCVMAVIGFLQARLAGAPPELALQVGVRSLVVRLAAGFVGAPLTTVRHERAVHRLSMFATVSAVGLLAILSYYVLHVYVLRSTFLVQTLAVEKLELDAAKKRLVFLGSAAQDMSAQDYLRGLTEAESAYLAAHQEDCAAKLGIAQSRVWFLSDTVRLNGLRQLCDESERLQAQLARLQKQH